jgi:hypothetical protein
MASNFEVRREGVIPTTSGLTPSGNAIKIGIALAVSAKDADTGANTFSLASGRTDGFLTREVQTGIGLSDTELAFGANRTDYDSGDPGTPFTAGAEGSIKLHEELEVEGSDYIFGSGTGAITTGTSADTLLSFTNGKFYVAQATDWAQYRLVKQMTPLTAGNTRIYVKKVEAHVVAE